MKRALAVFLLLLLLGATAAKLVFFDFPRVAGNDMAPAIQRGDWLLVYKLDQQPRRGDLVLVEHPQRPSVLIRRVVALPGETIAVVKETPIVDGLKARRKSLGPAELRDGGSTLKMTIVEERIGETRYEVLKDPGRRSVDRKPVRLEQAYFVMSDNRNHGTDSRTFGPVPKNNIKGIVTHRIQAGESSIGGTDRPGWTRLE